MGGGDGRAWRRRRWPRRRQYRRPAGRPTTSEERCAWNPSSVVWRAALQRPRPRVQPPALPASAEAVPSPRAGSVARRSLQGALASGAPPTSERCGIVQSAVVALRHGGEVAAVGDPAAVGGGPLLGPRARHYREIRRQRVDAQVVSPAQLDRPERAREIVDARAPRRWRCENTSSPVGRHEERGRRREVAVPGRRSLPRDVVRDVLGELTHVRR